MRKAVPSPQCPTNLLSPVKKALDSRRYESIVLLLPNCFSKSGILFRLPHPLYKDATVDYSILRLCSHFLSVDLRKSRSNLFCVRSRWIS